MAAYIIVDVDVHDPDEYAAYRKLSGSSVEQYGGKFIVRGGAVQTLEGDWQPGRFVVIEFPGAEQARAWYDSPEYTAAKQIRHRTATSKMILVAGV